MEAPRKFLRQIRLPRPGRTLRRHDTGHLHRPPPPAIHHRLIHGEGIVTGQESPRLISAPHFQHPLAQYRRHSIRMGSYCDEQGLIQIHPALDQPFVPEYFVGSVVFHEMLHELHGVEEKDGRRCVHTPAFQKDERRFHEFERAAKWEQKHLSKLLRY